jgi:hypothetical protein
MRGERPGLAWIARALFVSVAASGCVTQISVNKDVVDTAPLEDTPGVDTPDPDDDTPDSPIDTPQPPPGPTEGSQGCAASVDASDGAYRTVGCLAPWGVVGDVLPVSDGGYAIEPGVLRRVAP